VHDSSLFAADIDMLLSSHLLNHVCVSLVQPPTLASCVVAS